jgi:cyanophycinase-like exopeptidase
MKPGKLILCSNTKKLDLWSKYDQVVVFDHTGARHIYRYEFSKIRKPFNVQKTTSYESLLDLSRTSKNSCIFIPGGNTFDLINVLDVKILKEMILLALKEGTDVVCESAGAIICGSDIRSAIIPSEDADTNDCGVQRLETMSLLSFVIFPHFVKSNSTQISSFLKNHKKIGLMIAENESFKFLLKELNNV